MAIGGLDLGANSIRCIIFDEDGNRIGFSQHEHKPIMEHGHYELDADMIWEGAKIVIREACKQANRPVDGIAVSVLGEAAVPLDRNGKTLAYSQMFNDPRGGEESPKLIRKLGKEKIYQITGVSPDGQCTIEKLAWIKNHADYYKDIAHFPLFEDFLIYRLTGEFAISYPLAARTMAFDVVNKCYSKEMIDAAEIDGDLFSPAVPSGTIAGQIRPELADELGVNRSMKVITGGHDTWLCSLGGGLLDQSTLSNVSGSCETISFMLNGPQRNEKMLAGHYCCAPYIIPETYTCLSLCLTSGSMVKWYRDCYFQDSKFLNQEKGFYQIMDENCPKDPSGLIVLPNFSISGTPDCSMQAKGVFEGLKLKTTVFDIFKALMEGTTFHLNMNLEILEKNGVDLAGKSVRSVGGGSVSPVWSQMRADIWNRTVETVKGNEAGVIGCAMLAGIASGAYRDIQDAADHLIRYDKTYYPDAKMHEAYLPYYERYKEVYRICRDLMEF